MRILITGATGFVGRHLTALLRKPQHRLYGTCMGNDVSVKSTGIELLECDLRVPDQVLSVMQQVLPERIYHLAAMSSVRESFEHPEIVFQTNLLGTLHLLEAARQQSHRARILVVGSSQVYGEARRAIVETSGFYPKSPYATSKACSDLLAYQYFSSCGLFVVRVRPFNHTGPGQPPNFVCSDFAKQVAEIELGVRDPVLCVGNLSVRRDFSDVRDVVRAYELLLEKGKPGEAYNVCSGQEISVRQILSILRKFCAHSIQIKVSPEKLLASDILRAPGSNAKLKRTTGWRPLYNIQTTLKDLYLYWKNNLQ